MMKKFHNIKISLLLFILSLSGVSHSQVLRDPPGYTDPLNFNTCFDQMGAIEFSSKQIFRGSDVASSKGSQVLTTYCIPLVGDLNGDGYPEIIGTGVTAGSYDNMKDVRIYNGQNGQLISTLGLGVTFSNDGVWHASPSYMALVNTGRTAIGLGTGESKNAELIVAFSNPSTTAYQHRIESFDIIYNSNTKQYRLYSRWNAKYYDGSRSDRLAKPIPQVLDFDCDGKAEVLVYNRIFDAETGTIKLTLGNLTTSEGTCVHVGKDYNATHSATGDAYANFSYTYDMDFDGTYDYVAGGMIYYDIDFKGNHKLIDVSGTNYSYAGAPQNVKDGHTGVADINGDGIPDVVVVRSSTTNSKIEIVVWDPNLLVLNASGIPVKNTGTIQPKLLARLEFSMNGSDFGNHSYVYIGDIDGREQIDRNTGRKYRLPEIAVLAGEFKYADSGTSTKTIARHPNLTENGLTIDTSPTRYSAASQNETYRNGDMIAVTWDVNATTPETRLKLSFALEHKDRSANTGFTLFDFDNDGIQEICYKDEQTIRIIKGNKPQIKLGDNTATVFNQGLHCTTGFEYPVIADVNNDASAEIIVVANGSDANYDQSYEGYIQTFGFGDKGFKFAPAWPVWNQFMYSPFKIKPDLTVPTPEERITNPLQYKYARKVVHSNNTVDTLYSYQPFNGNIVQTAYFMDVPDANNSTDETFYEPIIFLTESFIVPETAPQEAHRPRIRVNGSTGYIELTISNKSTAKTDISLNTPIAVYENIVSKETFVKKQTLDNTELVNSSARVTSAIKAGDSVRVQIQVSNPYSVYYVRLGDDSGYDQSVWKWSFGTNNGGVGTMGDIYSNPPEDPRDGYGIGVARRAYRDCDWRDQTIKAALVALNPDAATVQINGSAIIDIFANDEYPDNFPANSSSFVMSNSNIESQPTAGSLAFSGKKVIYTHNGTIPEDGIDKFAYSFMYQPTGASAPVKFSANVYIYILQPETGGFAACYGTNLTTKLKETPAGVRFIWWNEGGTQVPTSDSLTINFGTLTVSKTFSVKPLLPFYNGERIDFTPGDLTVEAIGVNGKEATMKWTGAVSTDWNDYRNWLEIKDGNEIPVSFAPTGCVNVIISKGAPYYPELTEESFCNNIHLEDRAMIAGIHLLTYQNASMELTLKQDEKDHFILWSAPLKNVYTGDYHFKKGNTPAWGDVYMNFFQMVNPDYPLSVAKENTFTATFGSVGTELPLGTAFTTKVTNLSTDATFTFPQSATSYTDDKGNTISGLSRTNAGRFITDGALNAAGVLDMPINGSNQYKMIHVPNPFMAYLDIRKFLQVNNGSLENSYKLWDGDVNSNYISVIASTEDDANRLIVDDSKISASAANFVPPLKSFFVMKQIKTASVSVLRFTADMLTTAPATPPYTLKSSEVEQNTLRIRASQDGHDNMTVLLNKEGAVPAYKGSEDSYKLFNEGSPIAVYTLSPAKDALAINSSGDFSSDVRLGLRLAQPGSIKLDFTGMDQFGYAVYLIDHDLKDKLISLKETPTYTFTTEASPVNGQKIELNDRFSLHFEDVSTGIEDINDFGIKAYSNNGRIYVESFNAPIDQLQIFNISGEMIYASRKSSTNYKVRASANRVYLVKAHIGEKIKVIKIIGK